MSRHIKVKDLTFCGLIFPIHLNTDTGMFYAEIEKTKIEKSSLAVLEKELTSYLERKNNLTWEPVLCIKGAENGGCGIKVRRAFRASLEVAGEGRVFWREWVGDNKSKTGNPGQTISSLDRCSYYGDNDWDVISYEHRLWLASFTVCAAINRIKLAVAERCASSKLVQVMLLRYAHVGSAKRSLLREFDLLTSPPKKRSGKK